MLFLSVTPPTTSGESDHDADVGCTRANCPSRQPPHDGHATTGGDDKRSEDQQVRDFRDRVRDFICNLVHRLRTVKLAVLYLPSSSREDRFLDAATTQRGR